MCESLAAGWAQQVAAAPDALAVIDAATATRWTRAELQAAVARAQEALPPTIAAGRGVAILAARNSVAWLATFLALQHAGAVAAAVDPDEPAETVLHLARHLRAAAVWRDDGWTAFADARPRPSRRIGAQACLIKLTSGSTGAPRALRCTHAQMIADGRQVCATMGIRAGDLNHAVIPLGHSYGLGNLVVPLCIQGTPLVLGAGVLPQILAEDIARWRPTVFPTVPALLRLLVRAEIAPEKLASLRLVISAGAPLDAATARAFAARYGRRVHGFYGSSETGGISFDRSGEATESGRSVGLPLEGVHVAVGRGGRFVVTSAAVTGRGRHVVADRGELNADGELVLLGRTGRMAKVAGRRLDLAEVEQALRGVPGVTEAWLTIDPARTERVVAFVATAHETATALRSALSTRLAAWKIPDRFVLRLELPRTARGKLDTRALRAML